MKSNISFPLVLNVLLLFSILFSLTSCAAIEGIFKTGFWAGAIVVLVLVGIVVYFISKSRPKA